MEFPKKYPPNLRDISKHAKSNPMDPQRHQWLYDALTPTRLLGVSENQGPCLAFLITSVVVYWSLLWAPLFVHVPTSKARDQDRCCMRCLQHHLAAFDTTKQPSRNPWTSVKQISGILGALHHAPRRGPLHYKPQP